MEPNITVNPPVEEVNDPDDRGWYKNYTRRVIVLWIDQQHILNATRLFLTHRDTIPSQHQLYLRDSLPRDVKVINVIHSWERRAFGFLLSHPSFPETLDGGIPPDVLSNHHWVWVPIENPTN